MRWVACTVLVGLGLLVSPGGAAAQGAGGGAEVSTGPGDAKEELPQAKEGDPVDPRRRPVIPGVLPPRRHKRYVNTPRVVLTMDSGPADLIPLPIDRERFLWAASPRLRTGVWFAVYGLGGHSVRYRKYEPEIVYEKKDRVLTAEVGAAVRFGRFELSTSVPLVGQLTVDFFQKGVVDHQVSKVDRMDMSMTAKVAFPLGRRAGESAWILTPYFTLGVPTGERRLYATSIGGRTVQHFSAGPKAVSALPGVAVGWRRGMFSAVVSVGILTRVFISEWLRLDEEVGRTTASWIGSYQLAFTPWRDVVFIAGLSHLHQLLYRSKENREDLVFFTPGIRFQPWAGLYGHAGVSIPLRKSNQSSRAAVVTLAVGWEFR